jgi:hypothetical protein
MGFGMPTAPTDIPALPVQGRGRRRLALLLGLAEAAAAVPWRAEPAANGRLIESWCSYQPKHRSQGGHHQQPSCHGHPPPSLLQGRDQAKVSHWRARRCNRKDQGP